MKKVLIISLLMIFLLTSCNGRNTPVPPDVKIIPDKCSIIAGQEIPLSIMGTFSPDATIRWSVPEGKGIIDHPDNFSVLYTAPSTPGSVIISAIITSGGISKNTTIQCAIILSGTESIIISPPVPTSETVAQIATSLPTAAPTSAIGIPETIPTIAISEVSATPCGGTPDDQLVYEYIELYNYGNEPIDVSGWWFGVIGNRDGTPDKIIPWQTRFPGNKLTGRVTTNTGVINPKSFALIHSPEFINAKKINNLRDGTVILTIEEGNWLGGDSQGIQGYDTPLDPIVLFKGTKDTIEQVVSTYGTPSYGLSPETIRDDGLDGIPYQTTNCYVVERTVLEGEDAEFNWRSFESGTPGTSR